MEPPAKRRRLDDFFNESVDVVTESRPASECVEISVDGHPRFGAELLFTHQQFPADLIKGYAAPALRIVYTGPQLTMTCSFRYDATFAAQAGSPSDVSDLRTALAASLPDGYPLPAPTATGHTPAFEGPPIPTPAGSMPEWSLPGAALKDYLLGSRSFSIRSWTLDSEEERAYFDRMSTLAMWLIESE